LETILQLNVLLITPLLLVAQKWNNELCHHKTYREGAADSTNSPRLNQPWKKHHNQKGALWSKKTTWNNTVQEGKMS